MSLQINLGSVAILTIFSLLTLRCIVDRLTWLMYVEGWCSRNWNSWPTCLQEVNKHLNLCAPGGLQVMEMVSEPMSSREGISMMQIKNCWSGPDYCSSVGWATTCKTKDDQFNSRSGHMPGLRARSLFGGVQEATNQWFSLSFFLPPSPLCKNKLINF